MPLIHPHDLKEHLHQVITSFPWHPVYLNTGNTPPFSAYTYYNDVHLCVHEAIVCVGTNSSTPELDHAPEDARFSFH